MSRLDTVHLQRSADVLDRRCLAAQHEGGCRPRATQNRLGKLAEMSVFSLPFDDDRRCDAKPVENVSGLLPIVDFEDEALIGS